MCVMYACVLTCTNTACVCLDSFPLIQMPSISPGRYNVSLRANDTLLLPIDIMTIRNIPLDLYILFDVSQSQREEISAIQGVSDNISESVLSVSYGALYFTHN